MYPEERIMDLIVERVDVWAASIKDKPGALAVLLTGLAEAGADLNFILARRAPEAPGTGVVFVTPLRGDREIAAAANLGFNVTNSVHSVSVEGPNEPGIASKVASIVAQKGINLRGMSTGIIGTRFIMYLGLDSAEDADKVVKVLQKA
jgi:hypothetical protein